MRCRPRADPRWMVTGALLSAAAFFVAADAIAQSVTCRRIGNIVSCNHGPPSTLEAVGSIIGTIAKAQRDREQREAEAASRAAVDRLVREQAAAEAARAALLRQQLEMLKADQTRPAQTYVRPQGLQNASPTWHRRPTPEEVASYYPPAAVATGKSSRVMVTCSVLRDGRPHSCRVLTEDPPGEGFGTAAVAAILNFALFTPQIVNGQAIDGAVVRIPVNFDVPTPTSVGPADSPPDVACRDGTGDYMRNGPPFCVRHGGVAGIR
jgi:TonB family protein